MKFRNATAKLLAGTAVVAGACLVLAEPGLASSGLQAERQLQPFSVFTLTWLAIGLMAIAGAFTALRFGFARHIGDAGQGAATWLIGAAFLGGVAAGGTAWLLSHFGLVQGAII